jgi:hypothetical protein
LTIVNQTRFSSENGLRDAFATTDNRPCPVFRPLDGLRAGARAPPPPPDREKPRTDRAF